MKSGRDNLRDYEQIAGEEFLTEELYPAGGRGLDLSSAHQLGERFVGPEDLRSLREQDQGINPWTGL